MRTKNAVFVAIFLLLIGLSRFCFGQGFGLSQLTTQKATARSLTNAGYLLDGIAGRHDVKALFADLPEAKQFLFRWLKNLEHRYIDLPCFITEKPESILEFYLAQAIRAFLVLDGLQNGDLVSQIGKIIESYQEGEYYEPGGLGIIKNGKVSLALRPSVKTLRIPLTEGAFFISPEDYDKPHIFLFHVHPLGISGPLPGPSYNLHYNEEKGVQIYFDVGSALGGADVDGEYHQILINKLGNRTFNIDYYAAEAAEEPKDKFALCAKLKNFRIVDLGVWKY